MGIVFGENNWKICCLKSKIKNGQKVKELNIIIDLFICLKSSPLQNATPGYPLIQYNYTCNDEFMITYIIAIVLFVCTD